MSLIIYIVFVVLNLIILGRLVYNDYKNTGRIAIWEIIAVIILSLFSWALLFGVIIAIGLISFIAAVLE